MSMSRGMSRIGIDRNVIVRWRILAFAATLAFNAQATNHEPVDGQTAGGQAVQEAPAPAPAMLGPQVIEQANALREAGDAEGAVALLRDYAPQVAVLQAMKRMTLASAYDDLEDWESALAQYAGVVEMEGVVSPHMVASAFLSAGHSCLKLGRYEDAVTHFKAWKRVAVEKHVGAQMGVHMKLSEAYKELGQNALVIENLEEALRLAEEQVGTADEVPNAVEYFRSALAEARRPAEQ